MPYLRPGDVSTKHRTVILNELIHSNSTVVEPILKEEDHMGYGIQISENQEEKTQRLMHFKTTIATSYWALETVANHANPKLKRRNNMTVHDYVLFLLRNWPKLDNDLCFYYIETYERARFSNDEFTLEEYNEFMDSFREILAAFHKEEPKTKPKKTKKKKKQKEYDAEYEST